MHVTSYSNYKYERNTKNEQILLPFLNFTMFSGLQLLGKELNFTKLVSL